MRLLHLILSPLLFLTACDKFANKYPGTAQQAGSIHLQLQGKYVVGAIQQFHEAHDKWPVTLSELVRDGLLTGNDLLYPRMYDLPDRRDILGFTDGLEWIYIPPNGREGELPLLIAPIPYTSSMDRRLPRPRRIIVKADTVPEAIDEDEVAEIFRRAVLPVR